MMAGAQPGRLHGAGSRHGGQAPLEGAGAVGMVALRGPVYDVGTQSLRCSSLLRSPDRSPVARIGPAHVLHQHDHRSRRDAGHARRSPQRRRADLLQALDDLGRQGRQSVVVNVPWQQHALLAAVSLDASLLLADKMRVLALDRDKLERLLVKVRQPGDHRPHGRQIQLAAADTLERTAADPVAACRVVPRADPLVRRQLECLQQVGRMVQPGLAGAHVVEAFARHTPRVVPLLRQAQVRVVRPQVQTVLCAAGEHAVRLRSAVCDQVVHQNTKIRIRAIEHDGRASCNFAARIEASNDALRGRLLVTGGAVDLSRHEQPGQAPCLEGRMQLARVDVVVLHAVAWLEHRDVLEALDGPQQVQLALLGQRRRDAVGVHDMRVEALRLQPNLMRFLRCEANNFRLN
eukprot:m.243985 g.243985  ORF g.243985 m.243985 type:complete len:404 (-) comp14367_c0_seq1:912-2123(-)